MITVIEYDSEELASPVSSACYFYKSDLLNHLDTAHFLPRQTTRSRDLTEFFRKFKLRASDGLLQKFWSHKTKGKKRMQDYWRDWDRVTFYIELVNSLDSEDEQSALSSVEISGNDC